MVLSSSPRSTTLTEGDLAMPNLQGIKLGCREANLLMLTQLMMGQQPGSCAQALAIMLDHFPHLPLATVRCTQQWLKSPSEAYRRWNQPLWNNV